MNDIYVCIMNVYVYMNMIMNEMNVCMKENDMKRKFSVFKLRKSFKH